MRILALAALLACSSTRPQVFGATRWTLDLPAADPVRAIALEAPGPIAVSERHSGEPSAPTDSAIFIDQFASFDGALLWHREIDASSPNQVEMPHAATDRAGNILLTGAYTGSVSFGGDTTTSPSWTGFLAKYDVSGSIQWVRDAPGCGIAIAADSQSRAYVVDDRFTLTAFDVDGTLRWSRNLGENGGQSIAIVATSEDDIVVGVGSFGTEDVTWLSSEGDIRWASTVAHSSAIALAADLGGRAVAANDDSLMLLDKQGYEEWQVGSQLEQNFTGVTVRADHTIIVAGGVGLEAFSRDGEPLDVLVGDRVEPIERPTVAAMAGGSIVWAGWLLDSGPILTLVE